MKDFNLLMYRGALELIYVNGIQLIFSMWFNSLTIWQFVGLWFSWRMCVCATVFPCFQAAFVLVGFVLLCCNIWRIFQWFRRWSVLCFFAVSLLPWHWRQVLRSDNTTGVVWMQSDGMINNRHHNLALVLFFYSSTLYEDTCSKHCLWGSHQSWT